MGDFERKPRPPNLSRDAVFVAYAEPQAIYEFMRARPPEFSAAFGTPRPYPGCHLLEFILLRRRQPMIDLALAEFGKSRTVLQRLYERASLTLRTVLCSNPALFSGDELTVNRSTTGDDQEEHIIWRIMRRGPRDEVRAICENPHISSAFYTALLECWDKPERLDQQRLTFALVYLGPNKRLQTPYENSVQRYFYDGGAQYEYDLVFYAAWALATLMPATRDNAYILYELLRNCVTVQLDDLDGLLAKWRNPEPIGKYEIDYMESVREALLRCRPLEVEDALSPDLAVRKAFYQRLSPALYAAADWTKWMDLDGTDASIWLMSNETIMASPIGRGKLRDALIHASRRSSDISDLGSFDERVEVLRRVHPEYFADGD